MSSRSRQAPHAPPTAVEIQAAGTLTIADVVGPDLDVLICGINPGLYSAAAGHHFARPGNRFWQALADSAMTPSLLSPYDEHRLPEYGIGLTDLVARTTARASELSEDELAEGAALLTRKVEQLEPRFVAILGVTAYRSAFARKAASVGEQLEQLAGARLWVLPNPSGLNAHYQRADLATAFTELRVQLVTGRRTASKERGDARGDDANAAPNLRKNPNERE